MNKMHFEKNPTGVIMTCHFVGNHPDTSSHYYTARVTIPSDFDLPFSEIAKLVFRKCIRQFDSAHYFHDYELNAVVSYPAFNEGEPLTLWAITVSGWSFGKENEELKVTIRHKEECL